MTEPYYQDDFVTIYHGNCLNSTEWLNASILITDPPYGINYLSGARRNRLAASITGDTNTSLRDEVIELWGDRAAIIFGTWRVNRPLGTVARLIWDTKGALGMGDLSIPWKPSDQEIYILGSGFSGRRTSNVLCFAPVQSMAKNGRVHPHQKPVSLLLELLGKCPAGTVSDPFAGSGSTLVAAKSLGRRAIGIEIEEKYCEIAAKRCAQDYLFGGA